MRVLVACEFSGRVREAFRRRGHEAFSCDLEPAEDSSPFHIQGDALVAAYGQPWDLMVAHPPCTDLSNSGARYWRHKAHKQDAAIAFVMHLARAPIPRIAIENPPGLLCTRWREPDQVVQPWQFGHEANKPTALWLQGLPPLLATAKVERGTFYVKANGKRLSTWSHRTGGTRAERARIASRTFEGIAQAMAAQWGGFSDLVQQMLDEPAYA